MFRSKLSCIAFFLLTISVLPVAGQTLREKAATHPLDLAYYLLTEDSLESTGGDSLTRMLFRVGRVEEALAASKIDDDYRRDSLVGEALQQRKTGDPEVALRIAKTLFEGYLADDGELADSDVPYLAELLAATDQREKLRMLIDRLEPLERLRSLTRAASTFNPKSQRATALELLDEAYSLPAEAIDTENKHFLIDLADLYTRNGRTDRSVNVLRRLWKIVVDDPDDRLLRALYRRFYGLGLRSEAQDVWKAIPEPNHIETRLFKVSVFIENKENAQAATILEGVTKAEIRQYMYGREVVKHWLGLGKTNNAENAADQISSDPDDYDQQDAYIQIADYYLLKKDRVRAKAILDKAFAKARTIKFEHGPMDSVGASSGSRKAIYLRNLRERFEKIGNLGKALETIRAIDDPHQRAKQYLATCLARFARDNARRLPRNEVYELLNQGQNIARKIDADGEEAQIMTDYAETLVKLRDREGASDKLAELLERRNGEYLEGFAILQAGEVFERYKLPLTDRLRKVLTAIVEEHEE